MGFLGFGTNKDDRAAYANIHSQRAAELKRDLELFQRFENNKGITHAPEKYNELTIIKTKMENWIELFKSIDAKNVPIKSAYIKIYDLLFAHEYDGKTYYQLIYEAKNGHGNDKVFKAEDYIKSQIDGSLGSTVAPKKREFMGYVAGALMGIMTIGVAYMGSSESHSKDNPNSTGHVVNTIPTDSASNAAKAQHEAHAFFTKK